MSPKARGISVLLALVLLVGAAVVAAVNADAGRAVTVRQAVTVTVPVPPTTLATPTTEAPDCTATTNGRDPEAFTARCRGPIVVTVTQAACLGAVGDGYRLAYRIRNTGPTVNGYVVAQVDDRPQIVTESALDLGAGTTFTDQADYPNVAGDGLVVSMVTASGETISSPAVEVPHCPQDPADVREAEQATTTT